VVGMDLCEASVRDANINATLNGITNCTFTPQSAEDAIAEVLKDVKKEEQQGGNVVAILDPPRAGLHKFVIQQIRKFEELETLIYVSCNIAGAGQNLLDLTRPTSKKAKGTPFRVVQLVPVDLFPHTDHCELVIILKRMADDVPTPTATLKEHDPTQPCHWHLPE
jgi:tRNA (uracil-5-)-methyltransferase